MNFVCKGTCFFLIISHLGVTQLLHHLNSCGVCSTRISQIATTVTNHSYQQSVLLGDEKQL